MSISISESCSKFEKLKEKLENINKETKLRPIKKIIDEYIFDEENEYLKIETLELVYISTLKEQLPPSFLKEIILGILEECETSKEYYFLEKVIKISFLENLFDSDNEEKIQKIKDNEVLSTYYFYKGISKLRKVVYRIEEEDYLYIEILKDIQKDLVYSDKLYDRIDSKYYIQVIEIIINILIKVKVDDKIFELEKIYKNLMLLSVDESREYESSMRYLIISLKNISKILDKEESWLNYREEYNKIFYYIQQTMEYEYKKEIKDIFFDFKDELLKKYIGKRIFFEFRSYSKKLEILIGESKEKNPLFFRIFQSILTEIKVKENKFEIDEWLDILTKSTVLLSQNKSLTYKESIVKIIKDKDVDKLQKFNKLLDVFLELFNSKQLLLTGYPNGDKIVENVINKVNDLLGNDIELKKLSCFQHIISNIINYIYTIATSSRDIFPIYYNSYKDKLSEKIFQDDLYLYLKKSSYASNYIYENENVADNGRCDIFYKSEILSIPLEMKKTSSKKLTKDIIEKNYIAQATTYTYPYDKIGIFILIDISEKTKEYTPNELENMVYVHQLESHLELEKNIPNVVVSFIIPARRIVPSAKSIYK